MRLSLKLALACGALAAIAAAPAAAGPVFGATSYSSSLTLNGTTDSTAAGAAYSGGSYYLVYGGNSASPIVQTDSSGAITNSTSPSPGIDFRSVFTDASGDVYARGYNNNTIYEQTSFGNFTAVASLDGLSNDQSQVVLDSSGTHYVANDDGTLQFWNLAGVSTGSVVLGGGFSASYPQGRGVSIFGNYALNYADGTLSAYSLSTGDLVDQTSLDGAATGFESHFSQSYANGYFFVVNDSGDRFVGYQIGTPETGGGGAVPEPATWALMLVGFGGLGAVMRRRRHVAASFA